MKRQFTETEWDVIKSMSNEWMQLDMFHRHWVVLFFLFKDCNAINCTFSFDVFCYYFHYGKIVYFL